MIHVCHPFGAFTTRIDESLGCGESGMMEKVRGGHKETTFTHGGMESCRGRISQAPLRKKHSLMNYNYCPLSPKYGRGANVLWGPVKYVTAHANWANYAG